MTSINTNVAALQARKNALSVGNRQQTSMERLSTALRVNSASDDAAGLAVATKMESQIRGINMAIRNSNDGISLIRTAEAGITEITNVVIRMRELAVQMHNGIYTDADRDNAHLEIDALKSEISKICNNTRFNGIKLLDGSYDNHFRAGNTNPEIVKVKIEGAALNQLVAVVNENVEINTKSNIMERQTEYVRSKTILEVTEASLVKIDNSTLGFENLTLPLGGQYSLRGTDADEFTINATSGNLTAVQAMDFENPTGGNLGTSTSYDFEVVYTAAGKEYVDHVTLNLLDDANEGITNVTITEDSSISLNNITNRITSSNFNSFVSGDSGAGVYSISGIDSGDFSIDSNGVIAAIGGLDFENPTGGISGTSNEYLFTINYTDSKGASMSEDVTINVVDDGLNLSVTSSFNPMRVTITVDSGSMTLNSTTGLTLPAGYTVANWSNSSNISFIGNLSDVNNALGQLSYQGAGGIISIVVSPVGLVYNPTNGSFYEEVTAATNWTAARADALSRTFNGLNGYLTNITSQQEMDFVNDYVDTSTVWWAGASDSAVEGEWRWMDGPEGGQQFWQGNASGNAVNGFYTNWAPSEPNDSGGNQDALRIEVGRFDDNPLSQNYGYVVEYSGVFLPENTVVTKTFDASIKSSSSSARRVSTEVIRSEHEWSVSENGKLTIELGDPLSIDLDSNLNERQHLSSFIENHPHGQFRLSGVDASSFRVDRGGKITSSGSIDYELKSNYSFTLTYISGNDVFTEAYNIEVSDDLSDNITLKVATKEFAGDTVLLLDEAIDKIAGQRAKLGAIENRLRHNIDNLTKSSILTKMSRGRIVDADYASETAKLSKTQILEQAAVAMLSQANQSKQIVLQLIA